MENIEGIYKLLTEGIKLMALPYKEQKSLMPDFVDAPFEVVDNYSHSFRLLPYLIEENYFSNEGIAGLMRLYFFMEMQCSDPKLQDLDEEQFENHPEWNKLRELAKETLKLIGEPVEKPEEGWY